MSVRSATLQVLTNTPTTFLALLNTQLPYTVQKARYNCMCTTPYSTQSKKKKKKSDQYMQ
jgi:hypothetical protein